MKNEFDSKKPGRKGKSVQNKIHEFFLKELESKRKDLLEGNKVKYT